jgi:hypothetical protein
MRQRGTRKTTATAEDLALTLRVGISLAAPEYQLLVINRWLELAAIAFFGWKV